MTYPTISEYVEAIKLAEENLDQLNYLRPVLDDDGNPVMSSGNFAVVFKMQDDSGRFYALKCFTREQEGRAEAYKIICDELAKIASPYFVQTEYYDRELFVNTHQSTETEFPVLLMDWVEGIPLTTFLSNIKHKYTDNSFRYFALYELYFNFNRFAHWIVGQPFAHGDLKPDNILVSPNAAFIIVDYDGMYFPQMHGQKAREEGSPEYRHPNYYSLQFDEHIDDFALSTISLSLCALMTFAPLFDNCYYHIYFDYNINIAERLLFEASDYLNIFQNKLFKELLSRAPYDLELGRNIIIFLSALFKKPLSQQTFDFTDLFQNWSSEEGILDRRHVLWKSLNQICHHCCIDNTVNKIGNHAFFRCAALETINIPNSVKDIEDYAFADCTSLTSITLPNSITRISDCAFYNCRSLKQIQIPSAIKKISENAFGLCAKLEVVFWNATDSDVCYDVWIDKDGWHHQSLSPFSGLNSIKSFIFGTCVTTIPVSICEGLRNLTSITMPNTVEIIELAAFQDCSRLPSIIIPNSVKIISYSAFNGCVNLTSIIMSDSIEEIRSGAFEGCTSLKSIVIPKTIKYIGDCAFRGCTNLESVIFNGDISVLGRNVFADCPNLKPDLKIRQYIEKQFNEQQNPVPADNDLLPF